MKEIKKFISYLISTVFAYFFPEFAEQGIEAYFATFVAFAPLVVLLAAEWNTFKEWEGTKAWISTGVISLLLAYLGYFLGHGMMAEALVWHPLLYGIGAWGVAVLGFTAQQVRAFLMLIFDYSYKRLK